jgi:transcriptional regulator with XRE-family HTH domain
MTAKAYNAATDDELLASIGTRLRALRKASGFTQDQAAARAGLARSTVSEAENGENPTLHTVVRLLRVYEGLASLEGLAAPEGLVSEPTAGPAPGAPPASRAAKRGSATAGRGGRP